MGPTPSQAPRLLSARWLNEMAAALRNRRIIAGRGIAVRQTAGGQVVSLKAAQEIDFRITGGTNPYGGVEQRPVSGGTWADLTDGRTVTTTVDPLYERNKNTSVPAGTIVRARRDPSSGAWIFDRTACTATATVVAKPAPKSSPAPLGFDTDPSPFTRRKPGAKPKGGLNSPPWSGLTTLAPITELPVGSTGTGISNPTPPPP